MTIVARRDPADRAKIDAIEEKLLANPEIAKLIDELGTSTTDANDLVRGMLQASITRGLNAEMDAHLGYPSGDRDAKAAAGTDNHRNGTYPKTVDSNYGTVTVDVPRDRAGTFLPTMVPKGSSRLTDVDDMIVSLYAGGGLTPGKWTRRGSGPSTTATATATDHWLHGSAPSMWLSRNYATVPSSPTGC